MKKEKLSSKPPREIPKPPLEWFKKDLRTMYTAHRLSGKVKNLGIKNLGRQVRKLPQGK